MFWFCFFLSWRIRSGGGQLQADVCKRLQSGTWAHPHSHVARVWISASGRAIPFTCIHITPCGLLLLVLLLTPILCCFFLQSLFCSAVCRPSSLLDLKKHGNHCVNELCCCFILCVTYCFRCLHPVPRSSLSALCIHKPFMDVSVEALCFFFAP